MFASNNQGNPYYYVNQQAFDMSNGSAWGSMNIHFNQVWDDMIARQNLYNVPLYDFSNFNLYGSPTISNPFSQILGYSLQQMDWQNKVSGGNGLFDANGNFQAPWLQNPSQLWSMSMGWNPSYSRTPGASGPKAETEEERDYQRKYNTLLALTKQLVADCDDLTRKVKDDLNAVIRNPKGTWKERYTELKKAYAKIDKETVEAFLVKAKDLSIDGTLESNKSDSFNNQLVAAGYEFDNSAVDRKINDFYAAIASMNDKNGNPESSDILGEIQAGKGNILDIISSYNSNKKGSSTASDKRIIDHIAANYDTISDPDTKETAKEKVLTPVVNALLNKARDVKDNLDANSRNKIEKAIGEVEDALNNSKDKIDSNLSSAFDTLYLLTRMGAMANLRNEAIAYYGEVDSDIFNKDLFEAETIKDLKAEGFTDSEIKDCEVKVKKEAEVKEEDDVEDVEEDNNEEKPIKPNKKLDTETVDTQIETLIKDDILDETTTKYTVTDSEGNTQEYTVYVNKKGDKRVFIVKDDKIVELKNAEIKDGKVVAKSTDIAITEVEAKASDIEVAHKEAVREAEKAEKERKAAEAKAEKQRKEAEQKTKETVQELVDAGILKEETIKYSNGKTAKVYVETRPTGNRETARLVRIVGADVQIYDEKTKTWSKVDDPKTYFEKEFKVMTEQEIEDAKEIGEEMEDCLAGVTTESDWTELTTELLPKVNARNILYVLKGYEEEDVNMFVDSFFHQVQNEWKSGRHNKLTKPMLGYVLEFINNEKSSLNEGDKKVVTEIEKQLRNIYNNLEWKTDGHQIDELVHKLFKIFNID